VLHLRVPSTEVVSFAMIARNRSAVK